MSIWKSHTTAAVKKNGGSDLVITVGGLYLLRSNRHLSITKTRSIQTARHETIHFKFLIRLQETKLFPLLILTVSNLSRIIQSNGRPDGITY
ncbi:hypothetical protein KGM_211739 [Danaus plexippus plexippus]|uniref:Uncharacterized protein n=1 Tax=Danaus plexippus plexippus TaxID=278856 RepID=A0A212FPL2_DANPL|nr:hypothetical protein KGM_211739 [Danaus plexippus plexippus]